MANRLIANSVSEKPFDKMNNQGRQQIMDKPAVSGMF